MLNNLFKTVLILSCMGGLTALLLLALKPFTKRPFGSRWQYYIWLAVLIVMMLPVKISLPAAPAKPEPLPIEQIVQEYTRAPQNTQADGRQTTEQPAQEPATNPLNTITVGMYDLIVYIWLAGVLVFFAINLASYWMFLATIRKNSSLVTCPELTDALLEKGLRRKIRVRRTNCINAPLITGLFRPTLVLPDVEISPVELRYILLHELTHLARRDLIYKWFAMLVNAVHWFNPLIYFVVRQINRECEISCDLEVTKDMTEQEKAGYMNTILMLICREKPKKQRLSTAMADSKTQIKRRFTMIKNATKKSKIIVLISIIAACLILAVSVFASGVLNDKTEAPPVKTTQNHTNILVIGMDGSEQSSADTIMLFSLNKIDNTLAVLSIPRDTQVSHNGQNFRVSRLAATSGWTGLADALSAEFGIPIDYFATVNFAGFRNIVDMLGGVMFDVPINMNYSDPEQNLNISLSKGMQVLDGNGAEQLIRYRIYPEGDIARVKIQQEFIIALINQKFNANYLSKAGGLFSEFSQNVVTDYPAQNAPSDIDALSKLTLDDIKVFTLPGTTQATDGTLYFMADREELDGLAEQYFFVEKE